ncbi:MAG: hypothetical protein PVI86_09540 [Phycisphaerae bacterium]
MFRIPGVSGGGSIEAMGMAQSVRGGSRGVVVQSANHTRRRPDRGASTGTMLALTVLFAACGAYAQDRYEFRFAFGSYCG